MALQSPYRQVPAPSLEDPTSRGGAIARLARRRPLVSYFVVAYAFAWAWWVPLALMHRLVVVGARPTHFPGLLGPLLAAFVVVGLTLGREGVVDLLARMVRWRVGARWYLIALSPLAFFAVAAGIDRATSGRWPDPSDLGKFGGLPEVGLFGVGIMLTLVNGFGEETGWRGYAIPHLQQAYSPLHSSLILTALWAFWHAPLFFILKTYRGLGVAAVPGFFLGLFCGALILTWLYNRSGGSILIVALWHGTYNLVSGTVAAHGLIAAIVSAFVMIQALTLVGLDVHARLHGKTSVIGPR